MTQTTQPLAKVVTVSAIYGSGGSVVAPQVAERLGLRFFDRLIHAPQAHDLDTIAERLTNEEQSQAPIGRLTALMTQLTAGFGLPMPSREDMDPVGQLRKEVATSVLQIANGEGGVILGRAAAVVAADLPMVFHVRLTGPSDRCLAQGMAIEGVTPEVAKQHQMDTDRAWSRFVNRLFDRDAAEPRLYHLVLDSTAIPIDRCVGLVADAATAFWEHATARRDQLR